MKTATTRIASPTATLRLDRRFPIGLCSCRRGEKDIVYTLTGATVDNGWICEGCATEMFSDFVRDHEDAKITVDNLNLAKFDGDNQ